MEVIKYNAFYDLGYKWQDGDRTNIIHLHSITILGDRGDTCNLLFQWNLNGFIAHIEETTETSCNNCSCHLQSPCLYVVTTCCFIHIEILQ